MTSGDDDAKHAYIDALDEEGEDEPSKEVVDIDKSLKNVGLRSDENGVHELHDAQDLNEDTKQE